MAPPLTTQAGQAGQVRLGRWRGTGVDLPSVIGQLRRLEVELTHHDAVGQDHPHPRNSVLNLVMVCDERERATACDELVAAIASSHPLRAILVNLVDGAGGGELDAEVTVEARPLLGGVPVQREQVRLDVRGASVARVASLVEPLLLPDLPTFLWWTGRRHLQGAEMREVLGAADVLIVDSAAFERPVDSLLELARLAGQVRSSRMGLADLRWARMRPWCEAIAQFFAPEDRRPFLAGLRQVELECAGSGPASRAGVALLASWLATALGWRLAPKAGAADDVTEAVAEAGAAGGPRARFSLRSIPNARPGAGEPVGARLAGRAGGTPFALAVELDRATGSGARVSIDLGGTATLRQRLAMPAAGERELLVHLLAFTRRDPVFIRTLMGAIPLLEALR